MKETFGMLKPDRSSKEYKLFISSADAYIELLHSLREDASTITVEDGYNTITYTDEDKDKVEGNDKKADPTKVNSKTVADRYWYQYKMCNIILDENFQSVDITAEDIVDETQEPVIQSFVEAVEGVLNPKKEA